MNILIVKTSAIGDVTHTLPALNLLRRRYPDAHIAWLVEEAAAGLVEGHASLNRVLVARRKSWIRDVKAGRVGRCVREIARFIRELRDTRYDLLIDFQGLAKSSVWVVLARARRKAGFGRGMEHAELSHLALNERVKAVDMNVHALERGLVLLERLGVPRGPVEYNLPITLEAEAEARDLLHEQGIGAGDRLVAISPIARWPTKLWEPARFGEVADRLAAEGCRVAFVGGPDDARAIDAIAGGMSSAPARLEGRTSLKALAVILQRALVLLSTDTGPMHVAAAVGTPVVAIFGPTAPWRTGPWGDAHTVIRIDLACSPCFKKRCLTTQYEKMACMGRITADEVVEAVLEKVAGAPVVPS